METTVTVFFKMSEADANALIAKFRRSKIPFHYGVQARTTAPVNGEVEVFVTGESLSQAYLGKGYLLAIFDLPELIG